MEPIGRLCFSSSNIFHSHCSRGGHLLFVFYDTETTGTNTAFDQILQFAAILTDERFAEIDRFNVRCRCLPWVVPAPMALKVTGIRPALLNDPALPSFYEMMTEVRGRLEAWGPAIFLGYNTIRFDEPLLQRAFWQSLHPPYLTVTGGNARMDILPIMQAASHLFEGAFNYPVTPRGRTGFKLDQLAPLNEFAHANAHDALGDVEATIHLAKLLEARCPVLWRRAVATAPKAAMASVLMPGRPVLVIEHFASGPSVWWGQRVDTSGSRTSSATILRLDQDWKAARFFDSEKLEQVLRQSPKPLRELRLNKAPIVFDLNGAAAHGLFPEPFIMDQSTALFEAPEFCDRLLALSEALAEPWPEPVYLEQKIFEGFFSRSDAALMEEFHKQDWRGRAELVRSFEDARLRQLAQRLVFAEAPDALASEDVSRLSNSIADRLHLDCEDKSLWRTLPAARRELDELRAAPGAQEIASEIEAWLSALAQRFPIAGDV